MQMAMFIFLKRNWEKDKGYLHQILHYFTNTNYPLHLLIFPEGTDYTINTVAKSKSYALKNNLPIYKHVLHPRLKGFTYCIEQLRSCHGIDAIYDVTVGYPGNICQSEFDLVMGNLPREVHFHIKRHPIGTIPERAEGLQKWCKEKWAEKEEVLHQFYEDGKFAPEKEERSMIMSESTAWYKMIFWIIYWFTFVCVVFMLLYNFSWIRWYTVVMGGILSLQSSYCDGFEMLQVRRHALTTGSGANEQNGNAKKHTA